MAEVSLKKAFQIFASLMLENEETEGVFFCERDETGSEQWYFGLGKSEPSHFEKGPFPNFVLTSFEGDSFCVRYFPRFYSSEQPKDLPREPLQKIPFPTPKSAPCITDFLSTSQTDFLTAIKKLQEYQEQGEAWVVNLAHTLKGSSRNVSLEDILGLYERFLETTTSCHRGGVVWTQDAKLVSLSPELFLSQEGSRLKTCPIKGTGEKDALISNAKERSELHMITDLLRNDLGQICSQVSLQQERASIEHEYFTHTHAEISGVLKETPFRQEDYKRLLPAGSVSGAPKSRALQYIHALEDFDRGWYTGTFGVRTSPERMIMGIVIRALILQEKEWLFPIGAGITIDSLPEKEWEETLLKARTFFDVAPSTCFQ